MVNPEIYTVSLGQLFHPFEIEKTEWLDVWRKTCHPFACSHGYPKPAIFFDLEFTNTVLEEVMSSLNCPHQRLRGMIGEWIGLYERTEFFPFEPELGYRVDERDFTAEARVKKLNELWKGAEKRRIQLRDRPTYRSFTVNMMLEVEPDNAKKGTGHEMEFEKGGMERYMRLHDGARPYLESLLKCQVFVAGQAYEAMPDFTSGPSYFFCSIPLLFYWFYPLDTGPLALLRTRGGTPPWPQYSGQSLALPMDPQKLSTLEMRFILRDNHLGGVPA